ncbi:MAG: PEP-CTERM sorting domain-containing protein [Planctomycetota bacterium]
MQSLLTPQSLAATAAAFSLSISASAELILIDATTNNGSFELAGGVLNTTKIQEWDGTPDIDHWTNWDATFGGDSSANNDSGVEDVDGPNGASDGEMLAFMQPGNDVFNLTTYVAQVGDVFTFSWDKVDRKNAQHTVSLIFDDGGTITSVAASAVTTDALNDAPFTYMGSYTVQAGDAIVGKAVGLGVENDLAQFPAIDNFQLTVVPEPGSLVLLGLGAVAVFRRRR